MTSDEKIMFLTGRVECLERHIIALAKANRQGIVEGLENPAIVYDNSLRNAEELAKAGGSQERSAGFLMSLNNIQNEV